MRSRGDAVASDPGKTAEITAPDIVAGNQVGCTEVVLRVPVGANVEELRAELELVPFRDWEVFRKGKI